MSPSDSAGKQLDISLFVSLSFSLSLRLEEQKGPKPRSLDVETDEWLKGLGLADIFEQYRARVGESRNLSNQTTSVRPSRIAMSAG
jgi:hypothetical protein